MKQQKKNDSFTKIFIRQNIHENKRLLKILFVLQFFGIPSVLITFGIYTVLENKKLDYYFSGSEIFCIIFIISFAVAFFLGIYSAIKSFRYLHNKTQADKTLALPLSTSQRFAGSYLSGLIVYLIPYLAAVVLGLILVPVICHLSNTSYLTGEYEGWFIICAAACLFTMIMLYTTTVFTCSCCGSIFESIVYTVLLNAGIPLFIYILNTIAYRKVPGVLPEYEISVPMSLSGTIGGPYKLLDMYIFNYISNEVSGPVIYSFLIWMIEYIIVIGILIAISFFLYKRRKAEDISKPFVYSFIYYIFIITAVISIEGFCISNELEAIGIVISIIMYITLDMIKTRGFKNFKKHGVSFLCYILSVAAAFAVVKLSDSTEGFGKMNFIPDEKNIKSVCISDCGSESGIYTETMYKVTLTDKESIKQIVKMHQATLAYYNEHPFPYNNDNYYGRYYPCEDDLFYSPAHTATVELTYTTNIGSKIHRRYNVPNTQWYETLLILAENDSMKKCTADEFEKSVTDDIHLMQKPSSIYIRTRSKYHDSDMESLISYDQTDELHEIQQCYRKDIMSVTKQDLLDMKTYCIINGHYIPECFKNTVTALKKYSVYFEYNNGIRVYNLTSDISICRSSAIKKSYLNSGDINTVSRYQQPQCYSVKSYDYRVLDELVKVIEPNYYTYEECYIISIDHQAYIVPPEYSSLAEEFIDSSDWTDPVKENIKSGNQK